MITIIADRYGSLQAPDNALQATEIRDYVQIRKSIRSALNRSETLIVYVRDSILIVWLSDLQHYPETQLRWQIVDPLEQFIERFGEASTLRLNAHQIAALQLHTLPPIPDGMRADALSWILGHKLASVWQYEQPLAEHATALAVWGFTRKEAIDGPLLELVETQLQRWSVQNSIYSYFHAFNFYQDCSNMLLRWSLQRYDIRWQARHSWGKLALLASMPDPDILQQLLTAHYQLIQSYWHAYISRSTLDHQALRYALDQMSGLSQAEFQALMLMLERCPEALDQALLSSIQHTFGNMQSLRSELSRLSEKIVPASPELPDMAWSPAQWLQWATQSYLPYYTWLLQNTQPRDYQEECALRYSDWLYQQYPSMLNAEQSPLIINQYQHMQELLDRDQHTLVVWLIVDGMTWWQGGYLLEMCERQGLLAYSRRAGIAMLPSITNISKRALVTGQPTIDVPDTSIASAARIKLSSTNIPAIVGYDLSEANKALQSNHTIRLAIVLFNMIDVVAHQTAAFSDNAGIRGYLEDLAAQLGLIQQMCSNQGRHFHILVGSDHGSTLLPKHAPSLALPTTLKEVDDSLEVEFSEKKTISTRAAVAQLHGLPALDQDRYYVLDNERFQLDRHYVVPRGYGYFKRRPVAWTHGGLSPEETIVPFLHLSAERPSVHPLELEIEGKLLLGSSNRIYASIRNLNTFSVQQVQLFVSYAAGTQAIEEIPALAQYKLELHFPQVSARGSELSVEYSLQFSAFGSQHTQQGQTKIAVRRLQSDDSSFDDMFD